MYQFFDPSIKPILTTDLEGGFIFVRTYGLSNYGYPDIILNEYIENYEEIFLSIIDRIFRIQFDINATWSLNGILYNLELGKDNLAALVVTPTNDFVRVVTINNPLIDEPVKYITKGLRDIHDHPEIEVNASIMYSNEILAYAVEEIRKGELLNEDYSIQHENYLYTFVLLLDRYGKGVYQIRQDDILLNSDISMSNKRRSHLQRIK